MRTARLGLGAVGAVVGGYGAWLLLSRQDAAQTWSVGRWLVGGVVAHDVLVAAVVLLAGLSVTRVVPAPARAPVTVGGVVLASVTLLAVPVLGRFGARADNPTLLDRDYGAGWAVVAAVVVAAVVAASVLRARNSRNRRGVPDEPLGGGDGEGAGGRRRPDGA